MINLAMPGRTSRSQLYAERCMRISMQRDHVKRHKGGNDNMDERTYERFADVRIYNLG